MSESENFIIKCPNCDDLIIIEKLNCSIFRHGVIIESNEQIDPHSTKELCEYYIKNKLIYGCGKPYKIIINENNEYIPIKCDYE